MSKAPSKVLNKSKPPEQKYRKAKSVKLQAAKSKQKLKVSKVSKNQGSRTNNIGKAMPPKTQRQLQSFMFGQKSGDQYSCDMSALGKSSNAGKKSLKMLRKKYPVDADFRESKTPRDMIPKLSAWDIVKEKDVTEITGGDEDPNESNIRPSFDKEKYMKNNCINNRTKLQLDQVQNNESEPFNAKLASNGMFLGKTRYSTKGWASYR
jgi:hypothetical protein